MLNHGYFPNGKSFKQKLAGPEKINNLSDGITVKVKNSARPDENGLRKLALSKDLYVK